MISDWDYSYLMCFCVEQSNHCGYKGQQVSSINPTNGLLKNNRLMRCTMLGGTFSKGLTKHFITATADVELRAQNSAAAVELARRGICCIGAIRNDTVQDTKSPDLL